MRNINASTSPQNTGKKAPSIAGSVLVKPLESNPSRWQRFKNWLSKIFGSSEPKEFVDVKHAMKPPRRKVKVAVTDRYFYQYDTSGCAETCNETGARVGSPWCHFSCDKKEESSPVNKWVKCEFINVKN